MEKYHLPYVIRTVPPLQLAEHRVAPLSRGHSPRMSDVSSSPHWHTQCREPKTARASVQASQRLEASSLVIYKPEHSKEFFGQAPPSPAEVAQGIAEFIQQGLRENGLDVAPPCPARLQVFSSAFDALAAHLPSYQSVLNAIKREYHATIDHYETKIQSVSKLQSRLKTLKHETTSKYSELQCTASQNLSDMERKLTEARKRLGVQDRDLKMVREENDTVKEQYHSSQARCEELHEQSYQLVRHSRRAVEAVEEIKKREVAQQSEITRLKNKLAESENHLKALEEQLHEETQSRSKLIDRETYQALLEKLRQKQDHIAELMDKCQAMQRDYDAATRLYSELVGLDPKAIRRDQARCLTPRPTWRPIADSGIVSAFESDRQRTWQRADEVQSLLDHVFRRSRALVYAYGVHTAHQNSSLLSSKGQTDRMVAELQIMIGDRGDVGDVEDAEDVQTTETDRCLLTPPVAPGTPDGEDGSKAVRARPADFPPCVAAAGTAVLIRKEPIVRLRLSRGVTKEFLMGLLKRRHKLKHSHLPFFTYMLDNLPHQLSDPSAKTQWGLSVVDAVCRYAAEPSFLGFLMLLTGHLPDWVVEDNESLCSNLLKRLAGDRSAPPTNPATSPEPAKQDDGQAAEGTAAPPIQQHDGVCLLPPVASPAPWRASLRMTKKVFFERLQKAYYNKPRSNWEELQSALPAGPNRLIVEAAELLNDDLHVLCPFAYAIRIQHLDERYKQLKITEETLRETLQGTSVPVPVAASPRAAEAAEAGEGEEAAEHSQNLQSRMLRRLSAGTVPKDVAIQGPTINVVDVAEALGNLGMKTKDFSVSSDLLLEAGFARPVTTLDDDTTIPLHVFLKNIRQTPIFPALRAMRSTSPQSGPRPPSEQ